MLKIIISDADTDSAPTQLTFRQTSVRIGRNPNNDIVLSNLAVSNYHGEIRHSADGTVYRDLQSTNGSVIRRGSKLLRLDAQLHRIAIEDGDALLLGFLDKPVMVHIQIAEDVVTKAGELPNSEIAVAETLDIAQSLEAT